MLTRSDLLKPADRRYAEFPLPDGRMFRLRSLTEAERSQFEFSSLGKDGKPSRERMQSSRRRLVCLTLVDEQNNPLLSPSDESQLQDQDGAIVDAIFQAALSHCGLGNGGGVADAEKN